MAAADPAKRVDLVLEGGGVKGLGLAGAIMALDEAGWTFPRVAGTSAGAIAAALVAALGRAGEPLSRIADIITTCDYAQFMREGSVRRHLGMLGDGVHLLVHTGLYDGAYLVEWMGEQLRRIGVETFGDLRLDGDEYAALPANQRYSLVVHTSDITRGRLVRLPWDYPAYLGETDLDGMRIVDAVRASMSIPFFFEPVDVKAVRSEFDGCTYDAGSVTWVDGGMLSNFPLEVFGADQGASVGRPVVGIKLSAKQVSVPPTHHIGDLGGEALACLHTMMNNADRYYVSSAKAARTIFVDNAGVQATDFHLTPAQQQTLLDNGRTAARTWMAAQAAAAAPAAPV